VQLLFANGTVKMLVLC